MGLIRTSLASTSRTCPPSLLTSSARSKRFISRSAPSRYQHVLYLGDVLGYTSASRLSKFPRAWLDAAGVAADVDHGLRWVAASGGVNHVLLGYEVLVSPLEGVRRGRDSGEEIVVHGARPEEGEGGLRNGKGKDEEREGEILEESGGKTSTSRHPSKVFALGRNTHAQLGLGFSSQEATRGMVTGTLDGVGGVTHVAAGSGFSFVTTATGSGSNTFGFGNDTLGQLGCSPREPATRNEFDPWDVSTRLPDSEAAQLRLLPLPKQIDLDGEWEVKSIAAGLDHSLLLLEREVSGFVVQEVRSTGLNTDGQLGVTPREKAEAVPIEPLLSRSFKAVPLPLQPTAGKRAESTAAGGASGSAKAAAGKAKQRGAEAASTEAIQTPASSPTGAERILKVVCGADTSYALTPTGIWAWGNSEYGQTFAGVHDRIAAPVFVPNPLPAAYASHSLPSDGALGVRKLVAGGSFAALLDSEGRVWVVGYGPRGVTNVDDPDEWARLTLIDLPKVQALFAGLEYLVAVTEDGEVFLWGIPPRSVSTQPMVAPTRIGWTLPKTPRQAWLDENPRLKAKVSEEESGKVSVIGAACTRDHLLLILDDGVGKNVWAECDQPPREKGTDVTMG
ncbi:Regulator of chromosome condensation 1/beta-lactamase-inhibitor protein II [Kalmanozyma brasiliensis GHG001]|uniref:Regulator of chromosome condensation 1/beta-lactamase-inhibitor protein II n=1 Tax=Kalmanozyma brasiliensis (strain GHG001) TaxID=1365824 RepID=UPI002867F001|nr:Regulator of chromosome condensation 1/beta-lactamase-inhibitor protein II [Kalmanozyma brasiliensis GHG001]EST06915.2 Regulator of chromosome condensation 1/beta-lactamase-inhibitor protein II [Kalmanozyma brasiliensis GHG001]